jgi:hypothetical protein
VGAAGAVVVPGSADDSPPVLLSVYFAAPPDKDVVEQVDRLEAVVAGAVAVVEHCAGQELRADQMMHMMQYRRVIEQSKGAIMGSLGTDATAAFATLARASQHFNVRLRNLAVALVEHVGHAPAEAPDDPEQVVVPTDRDRTAAAQVWAALAGGPDDPGQAGARGERRG